MGTLAFNELINFRKVLMSEEYSESNQISKYDSFVI